jgi:hypothetical protein
MPIRNRREPRHNRSIVHYGLALAHARGATLGRGAQTGAPLPVYHAVPGKDGNPSAKARLIGWDYPVTDGESLLGLARLRRPPGGFVFDGVTHGWLVEFLAEAAHLAHEKLRRGRKPVEPRLLKMPAVGVALWLHGVGSDHYVLLARRPGAPELAIESKAQLARRINAARRLAAAAARKAKLRTRKTLK